MLISGIQKFTLLDYPEHTACIIFTGGCNFRCGYCHNSEFVLPELLQKLRTTFISEKAVMNFLRQRVGLLDGVVVTGGEPTIHPDLLRFMKEIKALGFDVKLDTNGGRPDVLEKVLSENAANYIAMDIKTSLANYDALTSLRGSGAAVERCIELLKNSTTTYELRTTLVPELHPPEVLAEMKELVRGAPHWYAQTFRAQNTLDPAFAAYQPFSEERINEIVVDFGGAAQHAAFRK